MFHLKGSVSQVIFVSLLMFGESTALPKRAYLVLETIVFKPDSCQNLSRMPGLQELGFRVAEFHKKVDIICISINQLLVVLGSCPG